MTYSDFHVHTAYSTDGTSTMQEMIEGAIQKGLRSICFTDHYDYDHHYEKPEDFLFDYVSAFSTFQFFKEKYQADITLLFGAELGLLPHLGNYYASFAKSLPFDYLIGSSHVVNDLDPYYDTFWSGRSVLESMHTYLQEECTCAKEVRDFDCYGHLDYAFRYHKQCASIFSYQEFSDELDVLLKELIESGRGIELNTGGYSYSPNEPNPHRSILKRYNDLGGEIITLGSDAHHTSQLGREFQKATDLLTTCGFTYYTIFKERKPSFLPLF